MKTTQRLLCIAVMTASTLGPVSNAFAEGLRGLAGGYLAKARAMTDGAFDSAQTNGFVNKDKIIDALSGYTASQGQSAGAISQNALSNGGTASSTAATSGEGKSKWVDLVPKKLATRIPKSLQ